MIISNTDLVSSGEAALMLRINPRTVVRWAELGVLETVELSPGGHRRFRRAEVETLRDQRAERAAS